MKENLLMTGQLDMESILIYKEKHTRAISSMINHTAKAANNSIMVRFTMVNLKMVPSTVMEIMFGLMVHDTKVIGRIIHLMDMVNTNGVMVVNTLEIGKIIK